MSDLSNSYYTDTLARLSREGNLRTLPTSTTHDFTVSPSTPATPLRDPSPLVDLSSNDYLGLASRPDLQDEFFSSTEARRLPLTSSASRLLAARQEEYIRLEDLLRTLYPHRDILLFNSGYHANTGIISAIAAAPRTLIVADRLVHASIIDGMTLSKAPFTRFPHNDLDRLERILDKERDNYDRFIVVAESIYSMDGDRADIERLIDIKERHRGVMLYIDEAHAFGVVGRQGLGLVNDSPRRHKVDVTVGTFGKACASVGAFCAVSHDMREYLVNRSRSLIFSTSLPPLNVAWTRFVIEHFLTMDAERTHLTHLATRLSSHLATSLCDPLHPASHIQPYITGNPVKAVALSAKLRESGFKVLPIRVPTVPPGTDRLRISLSAALTMDDIDRFAKALHQALQTLQ